MTERNVTLNGKPTSFRSRQLKNGETAYYRSGKRVTSYYQTRLARGILAGLTPQQARGHGGHDFVQNFREKALTQGELADRHEGAGSHGQFALSEWGASFGSASEAPSAYYADVRVTQESMKKRGSGTEENDGETCQTATLLLTRKVGNSLQQKFTKREIRYQFRAILEATLAYYRLQLCTGSLEDDVIAFWRHAER